MPPTRLLVVLVLCLVSACSPQGSGDDPVMQPPEGAATETEAPDEADEPNEPDEPDEGADGAPDEHPGGEELTDEAWTRRAVAPVALTEVASASFGGAVWTVGGLDTDGEAVASVLIYDPTFDSWEEGPALPEALHHTALVSTGEELYVLGGYRGAGFDAPSAAVAVLDPATGQWAEGPALPEARAAGAAAWDGTRVVYGGGVGPDGLAGEVWVLEGGAWRSVGDLSEAREHLAGASDGAGRVWFLAGRTGGLETNLATVDLVEGDEVSRLADLPTRRGGVAGLHLPGVGACALGGESPEGTFDDVECIDAAGEVSVLPSLQEPRHGLGAAVVEGAAYAVLGGPEPGLAVSATIEALRIEGLGS